MSRPRIESMLVVLLVGILLPSFGRVAVGQDRAAGAFRSARTSGRSRDRSSSR
jgi:type II secretory pathway pseudopilin PulG